MFSLKALVDLYGIPLEVRSLGRPHWPPFTIVAEVDDLFYRVEDSDGRWSNVLKECKTTNDYIAMNV